MTSSNREGFIFITISVKPEDSIWKTPAVSPRLMSAYTAFVAVESPKWGQLIRESGASAD